jgi:putative hydrolase of the HAD superfamily
MSRVQAILFDIGGVLLTNGWDTSDRVVVFERFGVKAEEFEARHSLVYEDFEDGRIPLDDYLTATLFDKPQSFSREDFFAAMKSGSSLLDGTALPILLQLVAEGRYRMGFLNNESRELNDYRLQHFGLQSLGSVFICSGYVGLHKPQPEIFRLAIDLLQLPASEIIFIDDRIANVQAASAVGLNAIHYAANPDALREELIACGVEFRNKASE